MVDAELEYNGWCNLRAAVPTVLEPDIFRSVGFRTLHGQLRSRSLYAFCMRRDLLHDERLHENTTRRLQCACSFPQRLPSIPTMPAGFGLHVSFFLGRFSAEITAFHPTIPAEIGRPFSSFGHASVSSVAQFRRDCLPSNDSSGIWWSFPPGTEVFHP